MRKSTKVQCILQHNPRRTQTEQIMQSKWMRRRVKKKKKLPELGQVKFQQRGTRRNSQAQNLQAKK